MNSEKAQALDKIQKDIIQFLKTGDKNSHERILEELGLDGSEITFPQVERLLDYLSEIHDRNTEIFLTNGIKQIIRLNYSLFNNSQKKYIYITAFHIYKNKATYAINQSNINNNMNPENNNNNNVQENNNNNNINMNKIPNIDYIQDLIIIIVRYFYRSIEIEQTFIEDVKEFCEESVEHLKLGLELFSNIITSIQDYQLKYKYHIQLAYIDSNSDLSMFHRKTELLFRQNLLPQIFDIPFQLLNTKKEDLMSENSTNFSVLYQVLNLLYHSLNYDYFDLKKVTDENFVHELSILSIPCREKKQENGYLNDLKSQEFTSTIFELYYFMINKSKDISIKCLQIISLLIRLSIKFFKKEDQKFSQMMFIIDGLHKIIQTHPFIFNEYPSNSSESYHDVFQAYCLCVSKLPIGISFSDGENLQGFWEYVVEVQRLTKISIERQNKECLQLLLEFWCGYDYVLGHDGAIKQEQLRTLVEKILKSFIKSSISMASKINNDESFENLIHDYSIIIKYFAKLSNTWIDQIEEILMGRLQNIFEGQCQDSMLKSIRKVTQNNNNNNQSDATPDQQQQNENEENNNNNNLKQQEKHEYQMYWTLHLLFSAQSYNIKEELSMTNKHYELDSKDEIKEDIDILHQAFESFGKLFKITLTLFKQSISTTKGISPLLLSLILKILLFLIEYVLSYKNHINFDYLSIIIKFTDVLDLKNYFYLNYVIIYFLDSVQPSNYACAGNIGNAAGGNGNPNAGNRNNGNNGNNNNNTHNFIKLLNAITSNLKATDQGVQIGCFPFDVQGFFESETFRRHKENRYDNLSNKEIQKIYECMFIIVDKYQQWKKLAQENEFQTLLEKLNLQQIEEDTRLLDQNYQKRQSSQSNNLNNNNNNNNNRDSTSFQQQQQLPYPLLQDVFQSPQPPINNSNSKQDRNSLNNNNNCNLSIAHQEILNDQGKMEEIKQQLEDDIIEIIPVQQQANNISFHSSQKKLSISSQQQSQQKLNTSQQSIQQQNQQQQQQQQQEGQRRSNQRLSNSFTQNQQNQQQPQQIYQQMQQNNIEQRQIDYLGILMNIISNRIQVDEQLNLTEQKAIFRNVLNQLIGIVQSSTMHTYSSIVSFILTNNIFYSIYQLIQQHSNNNNNNSNNNANHANNNANNANNNANHANNHNGNSSNAIYGKSNNNNNSNNGNCNDCRIDLNEQEINLSLKLLSELCDKNIYLIPELQEMLMKSIVEIIIATQTRLLEKQFIQNIKNEQDEWNLIILPLSYQYRIIFSLLSYGNLNFTQLNSQITISNMFHCLTVITPEKMTQYHTKLYWIYKSIHLLSSLHFEVFLYLQPLEFHSVTQIMEEALKVNFDCEEPIDFFINVLNQIFICKNTSNLIMNQYLTYSYETLIKVLEAIVLKVIRQEDLNQKNIPKLMLGYYWMLEKEQFLKTVNKVFDHFSYKNQIFIEKFNVYADDIEILDFKKYNYPDQLVLLDAKNIFSKIFLQ